MELFLPGLIILLLSAFFIFLVLPRMGPMVLVIVSILALAAAGMHHYSMFHSEYTLSTWQYGLQAYTPWLILLLALLFILASLFFIFGGSEARASIMNTVSTPMEAIQNAVAGSANIMPSANTATNPLTAALNTGITNVFSANNQKNNSPLIPGLNFRASEA